jgi:hypothetical protein
VSIGIFSYLSTMTFGINADFDAFPTSTSSPAASAPA